MSVLFCWWGLFFFPLKGLISARIAVMGLPGLAGFSLADLTMLQQKKIKETKNVAKMKENHVKRSGFEMHPILY